MQVDFFIDKYNSNDKDALLEIYNEILITTSAIYREMPFNEEEWQMWIDARLKNNFPIFVARQKDKHKILGFATFTLFRPAQGYRFTFEHSLHLLKEARGKGLGNMLMSAIITAAKAQNCRCLIGAIDSQNQISIALHHKFGFEISGRIPDIANLHGVWKELVIMHKLFDAPNCRSEENL